MAEFYERYKRDIAGRAPKDNKHVRSDLYADFNPVELLTPNAGAADKFVAAEDGKTYIGGIQSAEENQEILDSNEEIRQLNRTHEPKVKTGRHAARIPTTLYHAWQEHWKEHWADTYTWMTWLMIKLNDRSFSQLRTQDAKIHLPREVTERG